MATSEAWLDFEQIRHNIKNNTVDRLKQILSGLNDECGTHFAKSGKKQDIIDRICSALDGWRATLAEDKWMKAKQVIYQVRTLGIYTPTRGMPPATGVNPTTPTSAHATYDPPKPLNYPGHPTSSSIAHYDPYAPPRRPPPPAALPAASSSAPKVTGIRFKDSPFFTVDQAVTGVIECPESTSPTDRRQQTMSFMLNGPQLAKMKLPGSRYQLRLFCTSSIFYAGVNAFRSNTIPCPMEFPPTCEVRVNGTQITANLKGLKKKPGTAPPPDIGKYSRITGPNKIEMVYVNSQQPVQSKKYYMIVNMVESTTIDELVANLKGQHLKTAQDVRQKMMQALNDDDEIVAGPQKMSLKCPLTFVRISTPCRSSKCVHPQCFDATSWYTMMEQTTTWLCPVCERTLDHKDLIMDGYFNEILEQTPESVEDVIVEADGQWHTSDNKYGSAEWKASHRPEVKPSSPVKKQPTSPTLNNSCPPVNGNGSHSSRNHSRAGQQVYVLESSDEDDDENQVEGALTYPSSGNQSYEHRLPPATQSQTSNSNDVIDLTLDSDDDDVPIVQSNAYGKRKATEAELDNNSSSIVDQMWKKVRMDSSRILPVPRVSSGSSINGSVPVLPSVNSHSTVSPPPPPPRYTSFSNNTLPPPPPAPYPNYQRHGSSNSSLQLPPLTGNNSNYPLRQSENARRWP